MMATVLTRKTLCPNNNYSFIEQGFNCAAWNILNMFPMSFVGYLESLID